jgi:hypothetical protein
LSTYLCHLSLNPHLPRSLAQLTSPRSAGETRSWFKGECLKAMEATPAAQPLLLRRWCSFCNYAWPRGRAAFLKMNFQSGLKNFKSKLFILPRVRTTWGLRMGLRIISAANQAWVWPGHCPLWSSPPSTPWLCGTGTRKPGSSESCARWAAAGHPPSHVQPG